MNLKGQDFEEKKMMYQTDSEPEKSRINLLKNQPSALKNTESRK